MVNMQDEPDYYEILEVSPEADPGVIGAAYRRLAHKYHPDVNPDSSAHDRMRELNRALEILSDPNKREEYDRRRLKLLSDKAMVAHWDDWRPPTFVLPASHRESQATSVLGKVRRPAAWLAATGGVGITVLTIATMVLLAPESAGSGQSIREPGKGDLLGRPTNPARVEKVQPQAFLPVQPGEPPPVQPNETAVTGPPTPATSSPTAAPPRQVLPTVRDEALGVGPGPGTTPPVGATSPLDTGPTVDPETPGPQPPTATAPPTECRVPSPQLIDNGSQVQFTSGSVLWFHAQAGPDILAVDVAGTVLLVEITGVTDVLGVLGTAKVVNGHGPRSSDGTVLALLVEVVCPP
jgi:hypothetical protein